jgi:hypothetical protein
MTKKPNAVYLVESDREDPRGEGFVAVKDEPPLLGSRGWGDSEDRTRDFYPRFPVSPDWTPPRLSDVWRPLRVKGRVRTWNDFPTLELTVPTFSKRAVEVLRDILEANGELLPLKHMLGTWFAFNCRTVADIVDYKRSTISMDRGVQKEIDHYTIYPRRLEELSVFRMRHDIGPQFYATQPFVERVRKAGLRNFDFVKIWPWPKGTIWYAEDKRLRGQQKDDTRSKLWRHSLVIRLGVKDKTKDKQQLEHIRTIMDSLDNLLIDPYAPYEVGYLANLEGDERVKGEHRLFISCSNADRLVEQLRPWLRHLDWTGPVEVVKRYGTMHEEEAREETVTPPW